MTHYRCCGQVFFSEAALSDHLRQEHGLAPPEKLAKRPSQLYTSFTEFSKSQRAPWQLSEAAFSDHLREEHGLAPDDLLPLPFTSFSTATLYVRVDKLAAKNVPSCFCVETYYNSQNGNLRSKEVKE